MNSTTTARPDAMWRSARVRSRVHQLSMVTGQTICASYANGTKSAMTAGFPVNQVPRRGVPPQ
jgi:hypothetical protein